MAIAIDPLGKRPFITPDDLKLPEEQQTEWLIQDLTERQRVAFMDSVRLVDDGAGGAALGGQGSRVYAAVRGGLVGFTEARPLRDASGAVVEFETDVRGVVTDEFLQRISWIDKVAISDAIVANIVLDESDAEK